MLDWKSEFKALLWIAGLFIFCYYLPAHNTSFMQAVHSALILTRWYAREHVLLCLVPAFFIAGVISVFISQAAVIKYFGANAKKWLAYLVASVSGTILAVCSCTILPLFAGIYQRGAGIGPATAFLYSGPAINILAIILTARVLGLELGAARVIGAVSFSVIIGLLMHLMFIKEERAKAKAQADFPAPDEIRPLWQTAFHFFVLVGILVFANWGQPNTPAGLWGLIFSHKWLITSVFAALLALSLITVLKIRLLWVMSAVISVAAVTMIVPGRPLVPFMIGVISLGVLIAATPGEPQEWLAATWGFTKQILPLLAMGVLAAGFLLGEPAGGAGIIPSHWISGLVGGNSLFANFFASLVGAFMYFATLTEVPIVQGLINAGMGKGPALALLLAGPALSLPNMLVIRQVMGTKKTIVFVSLVVVMATLSGMIFGLFF